MAAIDKNNCIPSNLRTDIMRCSMENKNLLSKKGSIYVGTGEQIEVGGEKIYTTKALELGEDGEILQVEGDSLAYKKIINSNFDPNVDYTNVRASSFEGNKLQNSQFSPTEKYSIKIHNDNFSEIGEHSNIYLFGSQKGSSTSAELMQRGSSRKITLSQNVDGDIQMSYTEANTQSLYLIQASLIIKWHDSTRQGLGDNVSTQLYFSYLDTDGVILNLPQYFLPALLNRGRYSESKQNKGILRPDAYYLRDGTYTSNPYWTIYFVDTNSNSQMGVRVRYLNPNGGVYGVTDLITDSSHFSFSYTSTKIF